jgi:hypothetical protein
MFTTRSYDTKEPTTLRPTKNVNTSSTQRRDCHHSTALGIVKRKAVPTFFRYNLHRL